MPHNARYLDEMLFVLLCLFDKKDRSNYFPADFDTDGNIRASRYRFGPAPRIVHENRMYFVAFKRYVVLAGTSLQTASGHGLMSRSQGVKLADKDESFFSFGQVPVPREKQDEKCGLYIEQTSKTHADYAAMNSILPVITA